MAGEIRKGHERSERNRPAACFGARVRAGTVPAPGESLHLRRKRTVIMIELPFFSFCAMINARTRPRAYLRCWMTTGKLREELEFMEVIMNNKGIGAIFCLISAILMSARYIAAAIFMSNVMSWDSSLFQAGLSYVGSPLKVTAIIAFIAGICFLVYGVFRDSNGRQN